MALVFWIIGLMAGFALTRFGNFIGAVVPAGAVMVTVQLYNAGRGGGNVILAVYLLLGVLELGRMTYAKRRVYWKEQGVALLVEVENRPELHPGNRGLYHCGNGLVGADFSQTAFRYKDRLG